MNCHKKTILILLFFSVFPSLSYAESCRSLNLDHAQTMEDFSKNLKEKSEEIQSRFIIEVENVYRNEELTDSEKLIGAVIKYIDIRLDYTGFTEEEKNTLKDRIFNPYIVESNNFSGRVVGEDSPTLGFPKEFQDTWIMYYVLIHETEHVLENMVCTYALFEENSKAEYHREQAAMISEYIFLSSLPIDSELVLRDLKRIIDESYGWNAERVVDIIFYLYDSKSLEEFLNNMEKIGRYPKPKESGGFWDLFS